jgi:hypothetical protein
VRDPRDRHARRPGRIDGLKVRIIDGPAAGDVDLGRALRMLARMMVRNYDAQRDHAAIIPASSPSSTLTIVPLSAPCHDTDEAA